MQKYKKWRMILKKLVILTVIFLLTLNGYSQVRTNNLFRNDTIAHVGSRIIDINQLVRSYELHPVWYGQETFKQAYSKQLENLVQEKLFAQQSEFMGARDDSVLNAYLEFIKNKEIIKNLYKKEVSGRVKISDKEYKEAYHYSKMKVTYRVIFTPDSVLAKKYKNQMRDPGFDKIELKDSLVEFKGTVKDAVYGEMIEGFEKIVFNMYPKEIFGPAKFRNGFIIVELLDYNMDKFQSEYDFAEQKSKIKKIISERKSDSISNAFIVNLMKDKNVRINIPVVTNLSEYCRNIISESMVDKTALLPTIYIRDSEIRKVKDDTKTLSKMVIATYKGGKMTVGEFLSKLSNIPGRYRPRIKTQKNLIDAVAALIRNEFLLKYAGKNGFDKIPSIQRETEIQTDEILTSYFFEQEKEKINIGKNLIDEFKKTSPLFARYGKRMTDEIIEELLKVDSIKSIYLPELKNKYSVKIDSTTFYSLIPTPEARIKNNPIDFMVREIYQ
jgi:hypothetical protein